MPERIRLPSTPTGARIAGPGFVAKVAQQVAERAAAELVEAERARDFSILTTAAAAFDAACVKLEESREEYLATMARDSVELALEIARTLLRRELDSERHDIERIVREALTQSGIGRSACIVHVCPDDAERLAAIAFRSGTRIEADPELARGDVHISTPQGLLVRDIEDSLRTITERLKEQVL